MKCHIYIGGRREREREETGEREIERERKKEREEAGERERRDKETHAQRLTDSHIHVGTCMPTYRPTNKNSVYNIQHSKHTTFFM